ncbi:hypothetical protein [Lysinibacillus contaminans]|nr:hypothetical protein [Lysinibacillus contaminans]
MQAKLNLHKNKICKLEIAEKAINGEFCAQGLRIVVRADNDVEAVL